MELVHTSALGAITYKLLCRWILPLPAPSRQLRNVVTHSFPMQEACYTCRRRRIQCDRSQIPCRKCENAGLKCFEKRPVRWVQGVAIRGGMRGRSLQDNRVSSTPVGAIDMTLDSPIDGRKDFTTLAESTGQPASIPASITDESLARLDPSARYYLDYCK